MPLEILLGGLVAAGVIWITGHALSHLWTVQKSLKKKVEDHSIRLTRLETLMKTLEGD